MAHAITVGFLLHFYGRAPWLVNIALIRNCV